MSIPTHLCRNQEIGKMFTKLQKKWGISGWRFFWVMITFAVTGTTAAFITARITAWLDIEKWSFAFWMLKLGVLLIGYQILLLFFGFIFGQFRFFWRYEKKILQSVGLMKKDPPVRIAVFASGKGSNAANLVNYFNHHASRSKKAIITLIICNKPGAGVLEMAEKEGIPVQMIEQAGFYGGKYLEEIRASADLLVLAGFLWKIPQNFIDAYPGRIINIHPALLPKYGGKGMYGRHVHDAVIASGETESGITIHDVDEHYDKGDMIFQAKCSVTPEDTPDTLAEKIHELEQQHYPRQVEKWVKKVKSTLNSNN